jgi:citronellol/citronellal dehydrogenase
MDETRVRAPGAGPSDTPDVLSARHLAGRTLIVSGGSRGIGEAIAVRAARDGANVALLAKTATPHPKLPGTVYTAAEAVEAAGGRALPLVGDIRDDAFVADAIAATVETFGGLDIVVNNASAIDTSKTDAITMKKYDLMNDINARGSFSLALHAIPHLKVSDFAQILNISPPISLDRRWMNGGTAYTISKYGMSLVTLGLSEELREHNVSVNSLWPRVAIDTAAVRNLFMDGQGSGNVLERTRKPAIMADAAYVILAAVGRNVTGTFFLDDEVLERYAGITDLAPYRNGPESVDPIVSFWADPPESVR